MGVARSQGELEELAGEGVEVLGASVATAEGCAAIVAETRRRLGAIDVLVCNAGVGSARERVIWEQPLDVWQESLAVNLEAPFHLMREVTGEMTERGWGRIVVVSSTAGEHGAARMSAYCASKHGVLGLMRSVAQDCAPHGVTCNAVLPGWVRTQMAETSAAARAEREGVSVAEVWAARAAEYEAGRVLEPQEIADVIAFLASPQASGVNGEAVTVALGGLW
jgi:NAD(P)-dependent dehydrogenase (short-subunit alcohol dehydrogenase family)